MSGGPRPGWATAAAAFCAVTVVYLALRDLTIPHVRDTEVWFGIELRGPLALLTAPLHWGIYAIGAVGFWKQRPWIWPWASVYAFSIAASHLVWNLTSPSGGGLSAGLWQLALFSVPAVALLWARPRPAASPIPAMQGSLHHGRAEHGLISRAMPTLEFFFDYGSPYSYLADTQLPPLCERTGSELRYRPMLLGGVFKATGNRSPMQEPVEAKRAYGNVELARWIAQLGVPMKFNPHFPINTLLLMRAAHAAQQLGCFDAFHAAIYPAFWCDEADLGNPQCIADVLGKAGVDAATVLEAALESPAKDALRATTEEAVARGVFGAPTFFVGDEMFFGNDRLDFVERALGGRT